MTIKEAIELHRGMYRDDAYIERLVSSQPPTSLDPNTGTLHQEPSAAVGMTVSARLLKYVSHPDGFGADFPWSRALYRLRRFCRGVHPAHRGAELPYWRGSLCHQLVVFTVVRGFSVENTARILRCPGASTVLAEALEFIEGSMDAARDRAERRAREDIGHGPGAFPEPEIVHHIVDGVHTQECPQCRRQGVA